MMQWVRKQRDPICGSTLLLLVCSVAERKLVRGGWVLLMCEGKFSLVFFFYCSTLRFKDQSDSFEVYFYQCVTHCLCDAYAMLPF